ncbi:RNA-guided endonuclease TnpB family protein [Nitrosococcus oceani]|uniref:RNA-guided endonuclease TnpB family protein n=1 Tax=Nitrosococcus oceani TaxID=1229 RepID=UPI0022AFA447|nr:RNA-guided endonuclease TnpB family protein [Nitrosococcus oceani]
MHLPKLKGIKAKLHRNFTGKIKTVTVTRSASNKYLASVLIDEATQVPIPATIEVSQTLGLEHLLIDSEGRRVDNPRYHRQALKRLAIEQRKLARQQKGSSNRTQQRRRVARVHERVVNQRNNFIHPITARLVGKGQATTFAVEDLNVKGMVKNRKRSRAIQDVGWGMFLTTLEYKCRWNGKNLIRIARFEPSSKLCNRCGYKASIMPLSVRQWCCPACQSVNGRDINAAKNIRDFALADVLGHSACIKSSPATTPISVGITAKGAEHLARHGSQEAPARADKSA